MAFSKQANPTTKNFSINHSEATDGIYSELHVEIYESSRFGSTKWVTGLYLKQYLLLPI